MVLPAGVSPAVSGGAGGGLPAGVSPAVSGGCWWWGAGGGESGGVGWFGGGAGGGLPAGVSPAVSGGSAGGAVPAGVGSATSGSVARPAGFMTTTPGLSPPGARRRLSPPSSPAGAAGSHRRVPAAWWRHLRALRRGRPCRSPAPSRVPDELRWRARPCGACAESAVRRCRGRRHWASAPAGRRAPRHRPAPLADVRPSRRRHGAGPASGCPSTEPLSKGDHHLA